jgi:hypothetical protein
MSDSIPPLVAAHLTALDLLDCCEMLQRIAYQADFPPWPDGPNLPRVPTPESWPEWAGDYLDLLDEKLTEARGRVGASLGVLGSVSEVSSVAGAIGQSMHEAVLNLAWELSRLRQAGLDLVRRRLRAAPLIELGWVKATLVKEVSRAERAAKGASAPPAAVDWIVIDTESNSVRLTGSGEVFEKLDPTAVRILEVLHQAGGSFVSSRILCAKVPGCRGGENSVRRALKKLPTALGALVRGKSGAGRSLQKPSEAK